MTTLIVADVLKDAQCQADRFLQHPEIAGAHIHA
jgi:hypothetical protein